MLHIGDAIVDAMRDDGCTMNILRYYDSPRYASRSALDDERFDRFHDPEWITNHPRGVDAVGWKALGLVGRR